MTVRKKFQNFLQVSQGKLKEGVGKVIRSEDLRKDGASDQRVGSLKQAGEKVRDAFRRR